MAGEQRVVRLAHLGVLGRNEVAEPAELVVQHLVHRDPELLLLVLCSECKTTSEINLGRKLPRRNQTRAVMLFCCFFFSKRSVAVVENCVAALSVIERTKPECALTCQVAE